MKRILALILAIGMLFTMAPMSIMAQDVLATAKTGAATYEATIGETISVPFQIVPTSGTLTTGIVSAGIIVPEGLTYTVTAGIAQPADDENVFVLDPGFINIWYEASADFTAENNTLCTVNFTAEKAGEYKVGFDPEFVDLLDGNLNPLASAYDGDITVSGATLKFKKPAIDGDEDFDKFKAKGVYYDVSEDADFTGNIDTGVKMNVQSNYRIYDTATEEGLAAFKADANYATLGSKVETAMSNKKTTKASYTDKDSAYHFVDDYEGKPAMYGTNNVATQFVGNWKEILGAPNMYWMTVSDYFASTDTNATFVIQYFDNAGNFTVRYSKQGGGANAFTVTKGGTNTWVTKEFHVTDAMLNKGLTATGLIDNKHTGRFESASETYISKFAILKTEDYKDIAGIEAPDPDDFDLPTLEETLPEDASAFLKNSTLVAKLDFDSGNFTKDAKLTDTIDGFKGYAVDDNFYVAATEVAAGNLSAHLYRDANVVAATTGSQFSTWTPENALIDAPYAIVTYKVNSNNSYDRVNLGFNYKNTTLTGVDYEGSVVSSDNNGLPMIIKNNQINREGKASKPWDDPANTGCDNLKAIENGKYLGDWHTYTYLIDALAKKAYLYVDGEYVMSLVIYRNRDHGAYANELGKTYVSGIKSIQFAQDRSGGAIDGTKVMQTYYDDIMVRRMSEEQYEALMATDDVTLASTTLNVSELLPATSKYGNAIVWTTDNANVTVNAEGKISLSGATKYDNVKLTATFNGITKDFTVTVMAEPKYAEYIFGFNEDKAYGASSFNAGIDYTIGTVNGLKLKNKLAKLDEPSTVYVVVDNGTTKFVDADTYAAFSGSKAEYKNVNYINPIGSANGDSNMNRYAQVGPEGDKRDAAFGTGHIRLDSRLGGNANISTKIHFNVSETFGANDNDLIIEVDILDNRGVEDKLCLQYRTIEGKTANAFSENLANDGTWKTVSFHVTDADFSKESGTGLGDHKQDFRIETAGLPTTISAVRVYDYAKKELQPSDYTTVALYDYDVATNVDGSISAKADITAEEAVDARLYVAYYDANGNLVGVATSAQVTDGAAQTVVTGASVGANFNAAKHTLKTFVWDADLKPLR